MLPVIVVLDLLAGGKSGLVITGNTRVVIIHIMMVHCSDVLIHLKLTYSALWSVHGRAFLDPKRGRSDCTRAGAHWTVRKVTYSKLQ